jgi:hypothetical protein
MEFGNADRTRDSEYLSEVKDFNNQVEVYNTQRTKDLLTDKLKATGLKEQIGADANTNALKEAGMHANALAQGFKTAKNFQELGTPIKATKDILTGAGDTLKAYKVGDIIGEKTAQTIGKSAGKLGSALGVVGDIGSIGLDIAQDKANWGKMSTMDKIGNIADIGGASLDMVGTGLMTFGGPVGAGIGLGLKAFGDLFEVASGVESTISGFTGTAGKEKDVDTQEKQVENQEGPAQQEIQVGESEAGAGTLAVGRMQQ